MALQLDMQHFSEWIGKTETHSDLITPVPVQALSATLDRNDPLNTQLSAGPASMEPVL